jgi:twitching motility protein PilT
MSMMDERQRASFENHRELDFAYSLPGVGRFRVNVFHQRGSVGLTLRRVTTERSGIEDLGLPPVVRRLAEEPRGLVLVTGTAGSGKTTTLAAMIDHINHTREGHIVTIEDPIEVLHQDVKCIINQREIGIDTESYADALRHVVRQDPDVVLIGEMRDHETVAAALTAAEIGNLVLSTLHTIDATETINRIIDFFPPYQQKQTRLMLASTLKGIISMRLIPSINGGLVPAVEVMVMTGTIREYITDSEKTYLIRDAMEEGEYYGMQTFDQSLLKLYSTGRITMDDAVAMAGNAHDFKIKVRQLGMSPEQAAQTGIY